MQYTQDYDEKYPQQPNNDQGPLITNTNGFFGAIYPYIKSAQIYRCPSISSVDGEQTYPGNGMIFRPNGLNQAAINNSYGVAGTIIVQEYTFHEPNSVLRPFGTWDASRQGGYWHNVAANKEEYTNNHFDGGNLLFADGHVKWRKYTTLRTGEFGLLPDVAYAPGNSAESPCNGTCTAAF